MYRAPRRRNRQRGRIPSLQLHSREEDVSTEENESNEEIESERDYPEGGLPCAATKSDPTPSKHEQGASKLPTITRNRRSHRKKNGNWMDELEAALSAITDDGFSIREASRMYNIPLTSLRNHLWGTTPGRHRGICPTLKEDE